MTSIAQTASGNGLLAKLKLGDLQRLDPHWKLVPLVFESVIYEPQARIKYAYFPTAGVLSAISIMDNGDGIEVATVGKEGMLAVPAFVEAETSPYRVIVQAEGSALRIGIGPLKEEWNRSATLRRLLSLYQAAYLFQVSQSVACNGLHSVQERCCRWLLSTHDRLTSDELPLTHEFLAMMLGVRRSSVSEVLQPLQKKGLIRSGRGKITILDRAGVEAASCECYRNVQKEFNRLLG